MNYNEMMRMVAGRTGLTRQRADRAVAGTLTVLAETISAKETKDLLAQLPKSLRDRVPVTNESIAMRPIEFVARVAELTETASIDAAEAHVRAVFVTLDEAVNAGEMNDIAEELGDQFYDLLGRRMRAATASSDVRDGGTAGMIGRAVTHLVALPLHVLGFVGRPLMAGVRLASSRAR